MSYNCYYIRLGMLHTIVCQERDTPQALRIVPIE